MCGGHRPHGPPGQGQGPAATIRDPKDQSVGGVEGSIRVPGGGHEFGQALDLVDAVRAEQRRGHAVGAADRRHGPGQPFLERQEEPLDVQQVVGRDGVAEDPGIQLPVTRRWWCRTTPHVWALCLQRRRLRGGARDTDGGTGCPPAADRRTGRGRPRPRSQTSRNCSTAPTSPTRGWRGPGYRAA